MAQSSGQTNLLRKDIPYFEGVNSHVASNIAKITEFSHAENGRADQIGIIEKREGQAITGTDAGGLPFVAIDNIGIFTFNNPVERGLYRVSYESGDAVNKYSVYHLDNNNVWVIDSSSNLKNLVTGTPTDTINTCIANGYCFVVSKDIVPAQMVRTSWTISAYTTTSGTSGQSSLYHAFQAASLITCYKSCLYAANYIPWGQTTFSPNSILFSSEPLGTVAYVYNNVAANGLTIDVTELKYIRPGDVYEIYDGEKYITAITVVATNATSVLLTNKVTTVLDFTNDEPINAGSQYGGGEFKDYLSTPPFVVSGHRSDIEGYQSDPPGAPIWGHTFVVKPPGTGAWVGTVHNNQYAQWTGSWVFTTPAVNEWFCLYSDLYTWYTYDGSNWTQTPLHTSTDAYVIKPTGTGAWVGHDNQLTVWNYSTWLWDFFAAPSLYSGFHATATGLYYVFLPAHGSYLVDHWETYIPLTTGDLYTVGTSPSISPMNNWVGHANKIASYVRYLNVSGDGHWNYTTPANNDGMTVVSTTSTLNGNSYIYNSTTSTWPIYTSSAIRASCALWIPGTKNAPDSVKVYRWPVVTGESSINPTGFNVLTFTPPNDNDIEVKMLVPVGNVLFVGSNNNIALWNNHVFQYLDAGVGCVSKNAFTKCAGFLFFLHYTGIYRTQGNMPELISSKIEKYINGATKSGLENACAGHKERSVYFCIGDVTLHLPDGSINKVLKDVCLEFNIIHETWYIHTNIKAEQFASFSDDVTDNYDRFMAITNGTNLPVSEILVKDLFTDDGEEIPFRADTQNLSLGTTFEKIAYPLEIAMEVQRGSGIKVFVSLDFGPWYELDSEAAKGSTIMKVNHKDQNYAQPPRCRSIRLSIRNNSKQGCKISKVSINYIISAEEEIERPDDYYPQPY